MPFSAPGSRSTPSPAPIPTDAIPRRARAELGARFDMREFHDRVLGHRAVTLPMLRETIDRWIAEKKRAA